MDTKLNKTSIVILFLIYSCATNKKSIINDYNVTEQVFTNAFKNAVICGCINGGTNDKLKNLVRETNDLGLFQEVQVTSNETIKEADSIGRVYSNSIKPIIYSDAKGKKPIISNWLTFGNSLKIDSLARIKFKQTLEK